MAETLREIVLGFLKVGATGYGGPAIMGVMQAEFQERRQWVSRPRFVEGLSLVNMLPGATAVELAIFLGYCRRGWVGGVLAGLCFMLPAFAIMLALAAAYAALGVSPLVRGALYGLGPVVLGVFLVAVYRLCRSALRSLGHGAIAAGAAVAAVVSPLGTVSILLTAGAVGLLAFHARRAGAIALLVLACGLGLFHAASWARPAPPTAGPAVATPAALADVAVLFVTIGAFTFGGGLSMLAFLEDEVVTRRGWLTPREFIDGLALGQLTPGPILMVAAYVGYKVHGVTGAAVGALAIFLPSFALILSALPVFDRVRTAAWAKAILQGIGPGVIGVLVVSLGHMAPHAVPDLFAALVLILTVVAVLAVRLAPLHAVLGGALVGVVRSRLVATP
jgi:chromate transporter